MHSKISISVGVALLGAVAWTAWGSRSSAETDGQASVVAAVTAPQTTPEATAEPTTAPTAVAKSIAEPTTAPALTEPYRDRGARFGDQSIGRRVRGPGLMGMGRGSLSDEESSQRREALGFWLENSPKRYQAMMEISSPAQRNDVEDDVTRIYVGWKRLQPAIFASIIERVRAEDGIFHLVQELKKPNADVKTLKPALRESVAALVQINLKERQLRIDQLSKTLAEQQSSLSRDLDPARFETLVDDRMAAVMNPKANRNRGRNRSDGAIDLPTPMR